MLALVAFLMYVPLGIFLGVIAAWRRNSYLDQVISAGSLAFIGLPEFVTAVLLIALFSRVLRLVAVLLGHRSRHRVLHRVPQPHPAGAHRLAHQPRVRGAHDPRRAPPRCSRPTTCAPPV